MENGGNAKVNAIFEARLIQSGTSKPTNLADGPTRERFIRDKYERRKYYDPAGFSGDYSSVAAPASAEYTGTGTSGPRPGIPSETARQRVANRQARMKPAQSNMYESTPVGSAPAKVAQAPVSAPIMFDLLDFGAESTPNVSAPSTGNSDPFLTSAASSPSPALLPASQAALSTPGTTLSQPVIPLARQNPDTQSFSTPAEQLTGNLNPTPKQVTSNESIMALFGPPPQQQSGYGIHAMPGMLPGNVNSGNQNMMNMGIVMPQQSNQNSHGMRSFATVGMMNSNQSSGNPAFLMSSMPTNNNSQASMHQQHQQQMMMQNMMMAGGNQMVMTNPQMQQQTMMMQQQSQQRSQPQMGMFGHNSTHGFTASTYNNFMMQGMQQMNLGNDSGIIRQPSDDGGFGAPMGGSAQQSNTKDDPFSSLGGMNAFR